MKLDSNPFPVNVNMMDFEGKNVLVRTDQANTTQGRRVIVSPRLKVMVPRNPEPGKWKINQRKDQGGRVKVNSRMLLDKYARQQRVSVFHRLSSVKRERSPATQLPQARSGRPEAKERKLGFRSQTRSNRPASHRRSTPRGQDNQLPSRTYHHRDLCWDKASRCIGMYQPLYSC
jgi:hypothetical protein